MFRLCTTIFFSAAFTILAAAQAFAQKSYDTGASDREIKIGNITAQTGWAKAYGSVARAEAAYFQMVNERGGVNGRKITFISLDNESERGKALELTQELVEQSGVLLVFSSIGTETNLTIRPYLNEKKIPQLFLESSSNAFNDPQRFPWTMGFFATYFTEGAAYARYILQNKPDAKIAILYPEDETGREYLAGVREGLGDRSALIAKQISYPMGAATGGSSFSAQITELKNSGADVFLNLSSGPLASKIIRSAYDQGWHPLQFIPNAALSVFAFLEPAGLEKSAGIISNARSKGWLREQDRSDPAVRDFLDWMHKYNPDGNLRDQNNVAGYERAQALVAVLKLCGDDLTHANIMKQAAHLDLELPMLRPGIRVHISATDFQPIHELFLIRFDGHDWLPLESPHSN